MNDLQDRLNAIEKRNARVESDKAWETSWTRKLSIMALTYVVVVCYLHFVIHINPWVNALVPVLGYFLSTLTLGYIRRVWTRHHRYPA